MASEITIVGQLNIRKNSAAVGQQFSKSLDLTGTDMLQAPQTIATASTTISLGNITGAPKKLLIANLDATNYVEIDSVNTFDKFPQKVLPGDFILLSPETGVIYGKAHTAAVQIMIVACAQ
jgi:hypothetical protein